MSIVTNDLGTPVGLQQDLYRLVGHFPDSEKKGGRLWLDFWFESDEGRENFKLDISTRMVKSFPRQTAAFLAQCYTSARREVHGRPVNADPKKARKISAQDEDIEPTEPVVEPKAKAKKKRRAGGRK